MQKLLLVSIWLMTVVIGVLAAAEKNYRRGLKKTVRWMIYYCIFYLFALLYLFPRLEGC